MKSVDRLPEPPFMLIAHRGASAYAPENTLAAFDLALRMGVRHIELDVHLSADGHVVVIHDDTVDRTTAGRGPVAGHTLAALRALDAGSWFAPRFAGQRIPTLEEVLERYRKESRNTQTQTGQEPVRLHIEIKGYSPLLAQRTVELVRRYGMGERVTITSFRIERLAEVRAGAPELRTGWLVQEVDEAIITQARAVALTQVCPRADTVTAELVRRLHARGFVVRAWGVRTEELARQVVAAGADGMTVNWPGWGGEGETR